MGLLGEAALAVWWDIPAGATSEFEDWHSHEHMPERLRIPGFLRGTRWVTLWGGPTYFVMYEVQNFDTLTSKPYLERLNDPTPWSTKMFPQFRNTSRSLCHVRGSFGSGIGHTSLTIRFSPVTGQERALREWLTQDILPGLAGRLGMVGAHLLQTEGQVGQKQTREQELRGGDAAADWVLLVGGYDLDIVRSVSANELHEQVLARHGASRERVTTAYRLAFVLTNKDLDASG